MSTIDFNADVGEGMKNEALLMPYLTSCNIACGAHAGDIEEIKSVIALAKLHHVKIGAHPSYPDKANFGRLEMAISTQELVDSIYEQVLLINQLAMDSGVSLHHIKPHGALYHKVATDIETAQQLIKLVQRINPKIAIVGLPNAVIHKEAQKAQIRFIKEGFADRRYKDNGSLVNRNEVGAVLHDPDQVIDQVTSIVHKKQVKAISGKYMNLSVDTICFHSDTNNAAELLKACYQTINATKYD